MPGGTTDEEHGDSSHYPRQTAQDDDPGQKGALFALMDDTFPGLGKLFPPGR
jgi:hypothetical protein